MSCGTPFFLGDLSLLASFGGGGQREPSVSGAAVADPSEGQGADDQSGFFVGVLGGVVLDPAGVVVGAPPFTAGGFERGAGGGVTAGFCGEVAATPRHR
jgi:hypothetical protein